jgi:hypothetical protein
MTDATAVAASPLDTLQELALDITNVAADASLLKNVGKITEGTEVDVTPLLAKLEERMRANVVSAASYSPKVAQFPQSRAEANDGTGMGETQINRVFGIDPDPLPGETPVPKYDCGTMAKIIMARGLITTIRPGEFAKLFFTVNGLWNNYKGPARAVELTDPSVKPGDWTCFWNNTNYPNVHDMNSSSYIAENVIKVGTDSYYGWNLGPMSYAQWLELLRVKYNTNLINGGTPLPDVGGDLEELQKLIPGYAGLGGVGPGYVRFLDVPKIATKVFDYRTSPSA